MDKSANATGADGETYIVGDLRVDIGQQRVSRAGAEIALPNLSFQLFVALIRGAPNVVSLESLMESVWPGLVVSPETVNKRATLLRDALGDDTKEPRYIAAVRSRGYRLVADVTPVERVAPPLEAKPPNVGSTPSRLILSLGLLAVAAVVLVIGLVVHYADRKSSSDATLPPGALQSTNSPIGVRARTVAVMPFENISANTPDAYLARGLPEMILNRLSRVTGIAVIARNSSFALDTAHIDSQEIGRRLNSGYLVNGSVQRDADRLRVAVQLADTATGTLIWSANFDRTLKDIFVVEDEIADQVTSVLSAHVGGLGPVPVAQLHTSNIEAYLAYLQGRALLGRFSVSESESAIPQFEKAIALDPNFAAAYASLYDARMQTAHLRSEDLVPVRQRFQPLIERALAIDPDSGAAYFARAMWAHAPFDARNADFRRGIALDPSNGRGLTAYAEFLDYDDYGWVQAGGDSGNYPVQREEAKRVLQRALQIDPISPGAHFDMATGSLDESGAAALEQKMQSVLELDPEFVPALFQVAKYRWMFHGKLADAVQILEHAIALDPRNPMPRQLASAVYLDLSDERAARAVVAGIPPGDRNLPMLSMYAGDWRAAGRAAYEAGLADDCGLWSANDAVRDYALKTGELSRAIAFIKSGNYFEGDPATHLNVCNSKAAIVLSQLLEAHGQVREAQDLRRATVSWMGAEGAKYAGGTLGLAEAYLLDGRKDEALDALAADFRGGHYRLWWYTLKYDSAWLSLHHDPRLQAIAINVQRFVDAQRQSLEELRHRGIVPTAQRPGDLAPRPDSR